MPNVNFEINANIALVENSETDKAHTFAKQIKEDKLSLDTIEVRLIPNIEKPLLGILFQLNNDNLKSGTLDITHSGNKIEIVCNAKFSVAVKPAYVDDCKSNKMTWFFGGVEGIWGSYDIEGLEKFDDNNFKIEIKCS